MNRRKLRVVKNRRIRQTYGIVVKFKTYDLAYNPPRERHYYNTLTQILDNAQYIETCDFISAGHLF